MLSGVLRRRQRTQDRLTGEAALFMNLFDLVNRGDRAIMSEGTAAQAHIASTADGHQRCVMLAPGSTLRVANAHMLGAVMNNVDVGSYQYGGYYGYYYSSAAGLESGRDDAEETAG